MESSFFAAARQGNLEEVRRLARDGADVNITDDDPCCGFGWTALHEGSRNGHVQVAQLLVQNGANVNSVTTSEWTPLHSACRNGHAQVAQLLLQNGANVNSVTTSKQTPLHKACGRGHVQVAQLLLQNGANANSVTKSNQTPLQLACDNGHVLVAQVLLQNGANVDCVDHLKRTPLHRACENVQVQVAQLLLENGANVNSVDNHEQTPLHWACRNDDEQVAQLLLNWGAHDHMKSNLGRTPLEVASHWGHKDVVDLLETHGHQAATNGLIGNTDSHPLMNHEPFGGGFGDQQADSNAFLDVLADAIVAAVGNSNALGRVSDQGTKSFSRHQTVCSPNAGDGGRNPDKQLTSIQEEQQQELGTELNQPMHDTRLVLKKDWTSKNYRDRHPLRLKDELDDKELLKHCKSFLTHLAKQRCKQPTGSSQRVNDCHCLKVCLMSKAKKPRSLLDTACFMVSYGRMNKDEQNRLVVPQISMAMGFNKKIMGLCFPLPNHANFNNR